MLPSRQLLPGRPHVRLVPALGGRLLRLLPEQRRLLLHRVQREQPFMLRVRQLPELDRQRLRTDRGMYVIRAYTWGWWTHWPGNPNPSYCVLIRAYN